MQRFVTYNLVEEFCGTALLTTRGIEAAALLSPTKGGDFRRPSTSYHNSYANCVGLDGCAVMTA